MLENMYLANLMGPNAWIIILLIVVLLFGAQKIPEMMRGLGSGMKEFKKGLSEDEDKADKESPTDKAGSAKA
jgi:sec-independent protein translocase protein TatA